MSDYTVSIDGDFSGLLQEFKKVETTAQQTGQAAGRALGGGIEGVVGRTIDQLLADLGRLKAQKAKIDVDSTELRNLNTQITAVQRQIDTLRAARVSIQTNPQTIDGLTQKLNTLQTELGKVAIGSQRFNELKAQIAATEKELAKAGQSGQSFNALDGIVQGVALSLSNTLTNAAASAIRALAKVPQQIMAWDSAKAAVRTLGVDAEDLGTRLINLSNSTKGNVSAIDLLKASYDVASSGFASAADATNILSAAQDGAVGGFTDINTVADAATSVLNAYGLSSESARKLIDGFIQTQNDGKITVGQYAGEIGRIAPVAAASGVSIDELNAAIAAATAQGVPVGSTFAGLRQAISSILKPSKEASDYAKTLGLDFSASGLKAKGFGGLMAEVAQKTGGSADAIIKLTGSVEAQAAIQPLVNDGLKKYNQFLSNQANSAGVAARASDEASSTIGGSLRRISNSFSNLAVQAFQGLAPIITGVVNALNSVVTGFASLPQSVRVLITGLVGIPAAFAGAQVAILAFQEALKISQVQQTVASLGTLGAALRGKLAESFALAASAIPSLIRQLVALGATGVGTAIANVATALRTTFLNAVGAAATQLGALVAAITTVRFETFIASVGSTVVALAPLALAIGAIVAAVQTWQFVLGGANQVTQDFAEVQKSADKAVARLGESLTSTGNSADRSKNFIVGYFQGIREQLTQLRAAQELEKLQGSFTKVQTSALGFFNTLKNSTSITDEQVARGDLYIKSLQQIAAAATAKADALREAAVEAERNGDPALARQYRQQAAALDAEAQTSNNLSTALQQQLSRRNDAAAATAAQTVLTKEQTKSLEDQRKAEEELNKIIAQAPVRYLESQLAIGQQFLNLAKAIGDTEQSRFNVVKSRLQFELGKLQEVGASEDAIAAKKAEIDRVDQAALTARYQALTQQQSLENAILTINQEKARIEANLAVLQQRGEVLKAELALKQAIAGGDQFAIAAAQAQVNLQNQILGVTQQKVTVLNQTQPIERAIAAAQRETALNGLQAEAASKGFKINADGSLASISNLGATMGRVSVLSNASADAQNRFRLVAEQSGLAVGRTADSSLILGQNQDDVTQATNALNTSLDRTTNAFDRSATGADATGLNTQLIKDALIGANNPAGTLQGAFTTTAARGADVEGLNLDTKFDSVAGSMDSAAGQARVFYDWLLKASGLPEARWSGGPVEAGSEYRINELGQEAFLSAGRLSLIDAAPNSLWRAPSSGVVIPAGVTARLQQSGLAVGGGTGPAGVAELAIEVGKLRQEVAGLARKDWNVHIQQRTGPTASQVMNQIHRLR